MSCNFYTEVDYGWIWNFKGDNWGISWNPKTKVLYAKGAIKGKVVEIARCENERIARTVFDDIKEYPHSFLGVKPEDNG